MKEGISSGRPHVVIIGGGFGGIATAKALKHARADITIIDKHNHHLFQPLLYQVATAELSPGDIAAPIRAIIKNNSRIRVLLAQVNGFDPAEKKIILNDGRHVSYDYLVIATGAQYNYFGNEDWALFAPGLKTVSDALQIRENILMSMEEAEQSADPNQRQSLLTYVVIGGGPTGVEMAGAIAEVAGNGAKHGYRNINPEDARVYLIEAGPQILNSFPEKLGNNAKHMLEKMGVKVLLNTPVIKIERDTVFIKSGSIKTPNIIWAAGIKASSILDSLHAEQDKMGRVIVGPNLSVPGHPEVYVIGDAAHCKDKNGRALPALAPVANQMGKFVGKELTQILSGKEPVKTFSYSDKGTMATIGRAKAIADIRGLKFSGFFAWLMWSFIHILSLIGFRNRARVFVEWIVNYFTYQRGVKLITDRTECIYCSNLRKEQFSKS